jgi:tripartite-type tricarboxylate transporter receptor subunit TctC
LAPREYRLPSLEKLNGAFKQAMENAEFNRAMSNFDMPIVYRDGRGPLKDAKEISDMRGPIIKQGGTSRDRVKVRGWKP